jgi:hypothetical protein
MTDPKALARARELLAETESQIATGLGGPYVEKNLESHRLRVAHLEASASRIVPVASIPPITPVRPAVSQIAHPLPTPTGSREERLRRLATAMGADDRTLAEAIAAGTSPDEFVLKVVDDRDPDAVARRVARSDKPAAMRGATPEEEIAARIASA